MSEPIQLSRSGAVLKAGPRAVESLRREFALRHCIVLPRLIDRAMAELVLGQLASAEFVRLEHEGFGTGHWIKSSASVGALDFLMNEPAFARFIESVTGCGRTGIFSGRIYRMRPGEGDELDWHSDAAPKDHRMVALSLNLSPAPFEGGEMQIREAASGKVACAVANTGLGDAIVFRIAPTLQHRAAPVRGTVPRTAYAGWFRSPFDAAHRDLHSAVRHLLPDAADAASAASEPGLAGGEPGRNPRILRGK